MFIRNLLGNPGSRSWLIGLALVLTIGGASALAQEPLPPKLQALHNALLAKEFLPLPEEAADLTKALQERAKTLKQLTDKLDNLSDMAQGLLLPDWADDDQREVTGRPRAFAVDRAAHEALLKRFLSGVKDEIKAGEEAHDPSLRAAVATLVAEYGVSARSGHLGVRANNFLLMAWLGDFTVVLAGVAEKDPSPEVRAAAAAAIAKLQADPFKEKPVPDKEGFERLIGERVPTTVPALRTLLKDANPQVRRAGALALRDLLRGTPAADRSGSVSAPVVEPAAENLTDFGPQVARAAGAALESERDADVRRFCVGALLELATLIDPRLRLSGALSNQQQQLRPVVDALWEQTKAVGQAPRDPDNDVRASAVRTLEQMGNVRYHWFHPHRPLQTSPERVPPPVGPKPLRSEITPEDARDLSLAVAVMQAPPAGKPADPPPLTAAIKPLLDVLKSSDPVRNRLGAILALETITARNLEDPNVVPPTLASDLGKGPTAEVARALTEALTDSNRFIRWAAGRVLGKMAPLDDAEDGKRVQSNAIDGLTRLMSDTDPDVRLRAAVALELFGSAGESAIPAIAAASARGDLEARIAATHSLETIGGNPAAAVPALAISLTDTNVRLRRAAASALAAYGAQTAAAKSALNRALFDPDPEVRREASDALLKIEARR